MTTETLISFSPSESSSEQSFACETDLVGDFPIQTFGFDLFASPNSDSEHRILIV